MSPEATFIDILAVGNPDAQNVHIYNISGDDLVGVTISHRILPDQPEIQAPEDSGNINADAAIIEAFIWGLCQKCWELTPDKRPSMAILKDEIEEFMSSHTQSVLGEDDDMELPDLNRSLTSIDHILGQLSHLNLTGQVVVNQSAVNIGGFFRCLRRDHRRLRGEGGSGSVLGCGL